MANLALVFDLLAKDNASGAFRNVGNAAERAGKQTSTFGTAMSGAFKLAGGALLGAGLLQGFKALYGAADEARKISALTAQVIKTTGGAANVSAKQVSDLAGAIAKKTGVDDEAIQSGQNLLLTFMNVRNEVGKGNDIFNQATVAVTDMSVALGKDTSSSAIMLGKALNDPIKGITALSRAGVSFTAQQKDQIRTLVESGQTLEAQKIILGELGKEFGGAAEAAATPLGKLQQRIGDIAENIGAYLIPAVDKAATFFNDKLLPALNDIGSIVVGVGVPAVKALASVIGGLADAFNALPGPVQTGVIALGAFALLRGPVSGAMETIGLKALYLKDSITKAGTGIGGFKAAGAGLLGFLGGPWGIAIAGATVGLGFLVNWLGKSDEHTKAVTQATQDYAGALEQANGVINDSVRQSAAKAAQDAGLLDIADNLGIGLDQVTSAITNQGGALDSVRAKIQAYANDQTTVVTDANGQVTTSLSEEGKAALAALDALASLSGQTTTTRGDQEQLTRATATGTGTMQSFATQTQASRDALNEAKQAIDDYKFSLDVLTGNTVSMIENESRLQAVIASGTTAITDMGGAVLQSSGALNLQSENGRKAADVLLDFRDIANNTIATMIEQGATTAQVTARDAELRASFIQTANEMGITGQNAETLADQILDIPASRNTQITADTGQATGAIAHLQQLINGLKGRVVDIVARAIMPDLNGSASGSGRMGTFAAGGYTGDGDKYKPAGIVHAGEYVFTKEETAKAGVGRLSSLAKSLRGYAGGGIVAPASIVAELNASAYNTQMNTLARRVIDKYEPVQGMIGALQFARSQVGKPYVWGGVGPGGYDCSGFMSAITNVIRGRSPYSRVGSTASFPWAGFAGGNGLFTIGSTKNAGGGIGHMAGTLLGINVESTGGVGVKVGGSARGAGNGLFNTRGHIAMAGGGVIGEPVSGIGHHTGLSYSFGEKGPETVTPGVGGQQITVYAQFGEETIEARATRVVIGALSGVTSRGDYNG